MLSLQRGIDRTCASFAGNEMVDQSKTAKTTPMHSRTVETGWCAVTPATHLKHRAN